MSTHLTEPELLDLALSRSSGGQEKYVFDFGCGDGTYMDFFRDHAGCKVMGLDVLEEYRRDDVVITEDSLSYLDTCDKTFDIVFARESVYYLPSYQQNALLGAMTRILKPGGVLCIICYNGVLDTSAFIRQKDQYMRTTHNQNSLGDCLDKVPFKDVAIYGIKPQSQRLVGRIALFAFELLVGIKYKSRFFLERRRSESNPTIFSPRIALIAVKKLES